MKGTFHNLIPALALCGMVVVLANSHSLRSELVLCIGQDGHFEIEIAEAGRCVECLDDAHQATASVETGRLAADHCGDCDDIRLASGRFQARQGKELSKNLKINIIATGMTTASKRRAEPTLHFFQNPFPLEALAQSKLRTVRLLI